MDNYTFACIGTNKLVEDSFGPKVGDILEINFCKQKNIKVFGTTRSPIHFKNALIYLENIKKEQGIIIVIDSALGKKEKIGDTYINIGGIEIGKAFGKSFYFPANLSIKTIVGTRNEIIKQNLKGKFEIESNIARVNSLAQNLASRITEIIFEM